MTNLLDPLKVKGFTLKNRIVMPPMNTELATTDGAVTNNLIEHYVKRAKALGLLIIEHSYVMIQGKLSRKQLGIHDDNLIKGLKKLADSIHAEGTTVVIQINHAGRTATKEVTGTQPVAPSATETARELKTRELNSIADAFGSAADRAIKAGFDGVEIHGAHGFLLNQFYSSLTNQRHDKYGGSFQNRIRFPLEVVEKVKQKTRKNRLLLYRLGSVDLDPIGTRIQDSRKFARQLEKAGVDIIDVSGGLCGSRPTKLQGKQGYFIPQAQKIGKAVNVSVIGVGGITDSAFADKLIREGRVDLVAVGRELIKNPIWATEAIKTLH